MKSLFVCLFLLSSCAHKALDSTTVPVVAEAKESLDQSPKSTTMVNPETTLTNSPEHPQIVDITGFDSKIFKMRNIDSFEFNMVCWDLDGDKSVTYRENSTILAISDDSIILKENGSLVFSHSNCIMEATEKSTAVKYDEAQSLGFHCLVNKYSVEGGDYHFVEYLSRNAIWLIEPRTGQNIIISKNLCQIIKTQ